MGAKRNPVSFKQGFVLTLVFLSLHILSVNFVFCQEVEIKTYINRIKVPAGQQFALTVEISGSDAQAVPNPQLPDLSAFANFAGSSSSQSIQIINCLLYTSPSPRDRQKSRMPSSA